jgi:hypothetical protein
MVDNGKQFNCTEFRNFCGKIGIKLAFASINHPESNGVVERPNGLMFNAVSKSLFDSTNGKWAQELITSVWGHNISRTQTTGFTPFCLLYGEEAITPEELKLGSFRTEIVATTPIQRYVELKAAENARLQAASNLDKYHEETKTWRDKKSFAKEYQPRGHGVDSSSRQARQIVAAVVRAICGSKHGQTWSLQTTQRRRGQNKPHMECGQAAPFLPITSSPS